MRRDGPQVFSYLQSNFFVRQIIMCLKSSPGIVISCFETFIDKNNNRTLTKESI